MSAAITNETPMVSPTLVGRREELAALIDAVTHTPAVVSLEGEAGVGKTRLVTELLSRPEVAGSEVLVGRCHPIRESFPLGPIVDAIRAAGAAVRQLRLTPVAGALRPLLPELADLLPDLPDPLGDPVGERHRVFRGLAEIIAGLGQTVLVLEDLHWADEHTLDFVSYLLASAPVGLTLVLVYRGEEASVDVRALTAKLPPGLGRTNIVLPPLDRRETGELAAAILGAQTVSDEFAEYLHERTSGIPFVVEEVLALVRSRGLVVQTATGWARRTLDHLEVPRGIRDSTLARLTRLPAQAQRVAEALAVLQTHAPAQVLIAMTNEADIASALDEAIGSGLLIEGDDETLAFRHALAAQAVYQSLTGPRRRALHASAAAALRELRPVPLGQVAHHLKQAGLIREWAIQAEAAADQALGLGNEAEASRLLEDVLRHARTDSDERGRIAIKLARAALNTLHAPEIADLLEQVLDLTPLRPEIRGEIRMLLAGVLNLRGDDLARQRALFAAAVEELDGQRDMQAWAMVGLGLPIYPRVRLRESLDWLRRARTLADSIDDPLLSVFITGKVAAVYVQAGEPSWRKLAATIRQRTGDAPRRRQEADAYYSLGVEACHAGHLRIGEEFLTSGLRAPAARVNPKLELMLRSGLALHAFYSGSWDGLREQTSRLLAPQVEVVYSRIDVELAAGCLALACGDIDEALRRLGELIGEVERSGSSQLLPPAADAVTRALLSRGEVAEAAAVVRQSLDSVLAKDLWVPVARMLPSATEALVAAGERAHAAELAEQAAHELADLDAPLATAALCYCRGVLDGAASELAAAAEAYAKVQAPHEAARAHEHAARLLLADGDEHAADHLRLAAGTYERLGATWDFGRLGGLARAAGITLASHRRGRRGYGTQLSPREREVGELAAKGLTNNAIARELFVSVSTVEKHLVAVKRKLHARSRTELARRLEGLEPAELELDGGLPQWLGPEGAGHSADMAHIRSITGRSRLAAVATLAVGSAFSLTVAPLAQASPISPHPVGTITNPQLNAVIETSATTGWAVGYSANAATGAQPLTLRWNGTAFTPVTSPNPGASAELDAVSADSATDAWAVGSNFKTGSNVAQALLLRWNGTAWKQVGSPNPGTQATNLWAVKALSPTDAWAVGSYQNQSSTSSPFILHWNGTSWTRVPSPTINSSGLSSITAVSATDIWAVGTYYTSTNMPATLTLHWDGKSWTQVTSPDPGPNGNYLTGVSAVSATDVWAVGHEVTSTKTWQTLVLRWDGTRWKQVASPSPGGSTGYPELASVSADSATDAWAAGWFWLNGKMQSLTLHYTGASWAKVTSPSASSDFENLDSVSAASPTSALTVGHGHTASLILNWNGTSWTKLANP